MSGIRHYLGRHRPPKKQTYILNLESVGAGRLHYITQEGMLLSMPSNKRMLLAARRYAAAYGVTGSVLRAVPTEANFPLLHGYKAMTVMGLDARGVPPHWNWVTDKVAEVDEKAIENAVDYAEAILRDLDQA